MKSCCKLGRRLFSTALSPPRIVNGSGFVRLDPTIKIEEERMVAYDKGLYYPVHLDIKSLASWGLERTPRFGFVETSGKPSRTLPYKSPYSYLSREHRYIALKICVHSSRPDTEVEALNHIFEEWDREEQVEPSARKVYDDKVIYQSRSFHRKGNLRRFALPILSDFGEARIGDLHHGLIQQDIYRAPGVILGMEWT